MKRAALVLLPLAIVGCSKKKPKTAPTPAAETPAAEANKTPGRRVLEEILVTVNQHIITRKGLQQAVEQQNAALYRQFTGKELDEKLKAAREKTLQGLIDAFLIQDKAEELKISIPDDYIRQNVEAIKKENNFATDADFDRALKASLGIGMDDYLKRMKQEAVQRQVMSVEVYRKIAIEDQELRAWYEDHQDEYKLPSRFRVRELVIAKGATDADREAAKAKLAEVQQALKGGKRFEELAKAYSSAPSKDTGGDLGWMSRGLLRQSLEEAALKLQPEQVSDPLETDKDYILLQLIANEDKRVQPFEEVKPKILEKLQEPKAQNAIEQYLNGLRVRANIRYQVPKEKILAG